MAQRVQWYRFAAVIMRGPAVTRREMARSMAALFALAATLSLGALAIPHGHDVNVAVAALTSSFAYPIALGLYLAGERVPRWLIHAVLAGGIVMVAIGIHNAGNGRLAGSASVFYLWVAVYAAYFFPWGAVAAHLGLVAASYAAILAIEHEPAGPALLVGMTGTTIATVLVVSSLVRRLRDQATTDPLTGLPNRRGWEWSLEREFARAARRGSPLCVAVLDLDNFKALNDTSGHLAGDRVLKVAASTWMGLLRDSDVLARYGGDEFAVILPDCAPQKATDIIDRLCAATQGSTCSVGVAWAGAKDDTRAIIERADRALYEAKAAGGARVVISTA
jgi:diguanylate cyclase (GGDEF)-like protein